MFSFLHCFRHKLLGFAFIIIVDFFADSRQFFVRVAYTLHFVDYILADDACLLLERSSAINKNSRYSGVESSSLPDTHVDFISRTGHIGEIKEWFRE